VRSLQEQTLDPALWEIIVVDDGSGHPVGDLLESIGGPVTTRLITAKENVGRAAARNMGTVAAEGEILLFHDADMVIPPDAVQRHYEFHQRSPGSVLLGARYESSWHTLNRLRAGDTTRPVNPLEFDQRERIPHRSLSDTRAPWLWVYSNNISLPKSMLVEVGMFDGSFQGWGPEDLELGYRLYVHSGRRPEIFTYDSDTYSFHIPHYADWSKNHSSMNRNTEFFLQKHATYDIEIFSYSSEANASLKIPVYEEMIAQFLANRLGNVTAGVLDLVPRDVPSLIIGTWLDDSLSVPAKTISYDHSRPVSETNKHQLGMVTLLDDGALEAVVNVDFWRFLWPYELNKLIEESLRISSQLILVQTQEADGLDDLMASCNTLDYVVDMLGHRRTVTSSKIDGADVLHIS
jgi:glycosyltransferase involved in cell wall biosynthesis